MTAMLLSLFATIHELLNPAPESDSTVLTIVIVLLSLMLAGMCGVFRKADKPTWAVFVPIYGDLLLLELISRPWWWVLLVWIPLVGAIVELVMLIALVGRFGKSTGYFLGVVFLPFIFLPILGFGGASFHAEYKRGTRRRGRRMAKPAADPE